MSSTFYHLPRPRVLLGSEARHLPGCFTRPHARGSAMHQAQQLGRGSAVQQQAAGSTPALAVSIEEVESHLRVMELADQVQPGGGDSQQQQHGAQTSPAAPPAAGSTADARPGERDPGEAREVEAVAARALQLGLCPTHLISKIQELLLLIPGVSRAKLLSLPDEALSLLVSDTAAVATRLVQLKTRFPAALRPAPGIPHPPTLYDRPELLAARPWGSFLAQLPLAQLHGHSQAVLCVALTPDGRLALSGSKDSTLRLWDLATHACIATLAGHGGGVTSLAVAPDGRRAVSGSWDNTLRVWDLHAHTCTACLSLPVPHHTWVEAVAVTPDGRLALSGHDDGTIQLWDLGSLACIASLQGHASGVTSLAVMPDGGGVLSGSHDGSVGVWDLQRQRCTARLVAGQGGPVAAVAVAPGGRHALVHRKGAALQLWDLGAERCTATLPRHVGGVAAVVVCPDARHAVSGSHVGTLQVHDLHASTCVALREGGGFGHSAGVAALAITPDGRRAVSGSWDETLCVWDLQPHIDCSAQQPSVLEAH